MASYKCVTVPNSHLECSLCLNNFNDPRILPCGHTFCLQCIRKQINISKQYICGECRQWWNSTPEGINYLPKNFGLASIVSAASNEDISFVSQMLSGEQKFFCQKHVDQKIVIFCRDCKILACAMCGLLLHSKHTFIEVNKADEEFKSTITTKLKELNRNLTTCKKELSLFKEKVQQKRTEQEAIEKEIKSCNKLLSNESSFIERSSVALTYQNHEKWEDEPVISDYELGVRPLRHFDRAFYEDELIFVTE